MLLGKKSSFKENRWNLFDAYLHQSNRMMYIIQRDIFQTKNQQEKNINGYQMITST